MAQLQELTSYQGNAGLAVGAAGNNFIPGVVDNRTVLDAVDKFTMFSMQRNRDMWVQNNIELQQQAQEAAKNLSVKYGDLIPEDRDIVDEKVRAMYDFYHKNPTAIKYSIDPKTGKDNAEQYREFLRLKNEMDHTIVRGNMRANQLGLMQNALTKAATPERRKAMEESILRERQKPITENLIIPPDIQPFNLSTAAVDWAKNGAAAYGFTQKFDNHVLTVTNGLFDPEKAAYEPIYQLYAPGNEDMKRTVAETTATMNQLIQKHLKDDGKGNMMLDRAALEADPMAGAVLDLVNRYNQHIDVMNTTEAVEQGTNTKKKVYEFLGYTEARPKIDLTRELTPEDVIKLSMVGKLGTTTKTDYQQTNEGLTRQRMLLDDANADADRAARAREFNMTINKGAEGEEAIATEKIVAYHNLMSVPEIGGGEAIIFRSNPDGTYNENDKGWQVPVTQPLIDAFSKSSGAKEVTKVGNKDKSMDDMGATDEATTQTSIEKKQIIPKQIFVLKGKDADQNKVHIVYEDNTRETLSGSQVWTALNSLYGATDKNRSYVSESAAKKLAKMGLVQPRITGRGGLRQQIGVLNQGNYRPYAEDNAGSGTPPAPAQSGTSGRQGRGANNNSGLKPRPY